MRLFKLLASLLPLGWIGWLLLTFLKPYWQSDDPTAAVQVMSDGLGPTVVGLGIVGLIAGFLVLVRVVQLLTPRPAVTARRAIAAQEGSSFDPDAALERYLAKKEAGLVEPVAWPEPADAAPRPQFGRKTR